MKKHSCYLIFGILLFFFLISIGFSDYLITNHSANIYFEPDRHSYLIENVSEDTTLELLNDGDQENGYYRVRNPATGNIGWLYRNFVRRYEGDIPVPTHEAVPTDPLAEPYYTLSQDQRRYAFKHLSIGKPQAVYERVREGYVLAEDARLKIPLWVQYELSIEDFQDGVERTNNFREDTSIPFGARAELSDYSDPNYVRGHMAPAEDMSRSHRVMSDSFYLSNMAPQIGPTFNGAIWRSLENAVRGWVEQRGPLTIITGPVFAVENDQVSYPVIGSNHVAVPTHFYKIIVDANDMNNVEALAYLIPHEPLSGVSYRNYLVSINDIEALTGLDFLSALPPDIQEDVESEPAPIVW